MRFLDTTGPVVDSAFASHQHDLGDIASATDLTQTTVYSVAVGNNLSVFKINGTEVLRHTETGSVPNLNTPIWLGQPVSGGTEYYVGWASDVIVFDQILSADAEAAWTPCLLGTTDTPPTDASVVTLTYAYDGGDVIVTASARFATGAKIAASLSGTPSDADVRATAEITTSPFRASFTAPTGTDVLHVAAFCYFDALGGAESSKATLDIPAQTGTAPGDPAYVLTGVDADLPNSRVLTDTATITKDTGTSGQVKLNVVLDTDGTLAANSDTKIASQKAVKTYVDGQVAGLSWKQAVRAATTSAHTLASDFENGDTIDGVTLATGDRILIKDQATGSENGIYTVNASGAPTRATDADAGSELVNATVYVSEGTTNADTQWTCTADAPITVGTTALAFAQLSTSGSSLTVKDEGSTLSSAVTSIDLVGSGVTATNSGGAVTVTVPGGGGTVPAWVTDPPHTPPGTPDPADDEFGGSDYSGETSLNTGGTRLTGATAWAWVNQGSATAALQNGELVLTLPVGANSADNVRGIVQSLPGCGTWKYRAFISAYGNALGTAIGGMFVRESATGKLTILGPRQFADVRVTSFSNATTFTAYATQYTASSTPGTGFVEIEYTGSNYIHPWSETGYGWHFETLISRALTSDFTTKADQIGFAVNENNSGGRLVIVAPWFRRIA